MTKKTKKTEKTEKTEKTTTEPSQPSAVATVKKTIKITDMPLEERPREKLLQRGAQALTNVELLAIFLRTGVAGKTALDLARDLLEEFGYDLRSLLGANQKQFCKAKGLGNAKYVRSKPTLNWVVATYANVWSVAMP